MRILINLICIITFGIYLYLSYNNPLNTLTNIIAFTLGWLTTILINKDKDKKKAITIICLSVSFVIIMSFLSYNCKG